MRAGETFRFERRQRDPPTSCRHSRCPPLQRTQGRGTVLLMPAKPKAWATRPGNLYGTTSAGGDSICQCGTIFKLDSTGKETVLYRFLGGTDGSGSAAGLARDPGGEIYGTDASRGGANRSISGGI